MNKYIKIMRLDHWIKQLFILPGAAVALFLIRTEISFTLIIRVLLSLLATSFIASANYVINEWLDAEFDKYHPVKKNRPVVEGGMKGWIVYTMYAVLAVLGITVSSLVSKEVMFTEIWLLAMGVLYNVKPFRTKDIPFVDVLTESLNNAIRLLIGWFAVTEGYLPPVSIILGYWLGGSFLMATKRFAEYRMINNPETAGLYRKSFVKHTENSLMLSSFFYAMCSVFFVGIFLIKYKVELIIGIPFTIGLFCYYFSLSFKPDSTVQKPEKLFREKKLMLYVAVLIALFAVLLFVDIPGMENLVSSELIKF